MTRFSCRLVLTGLLALGAVGSASAQMAPLSARPAPFYAPQAGAFGTPSYAPRSYYGTTPLSARPTPLYASQAPSRMALSLRPTPLGMAPMDPGSLIVTSPFGTGYTRDGLPVAPIGGMGFPGAVPGPALLGPVPQGIGQSYAGGGVGVSPFSGTGYTSGGVGVSPNGDQ